MGLAAAAQGLDAFQALKVMEALKALADAGHTVVAAIHQPRSRIFDLVGAPRARSRIRWRCW